RSSPSNLRQTGSCASSRRGGESSSLTPLSRRAPNSRQARRTGPFAPRQTLRRESRRGLIMKPNKPSSTFDRIMKDPKRRRKFESKYRSFLLSEVIHGLMEQEGKSIRE